MIKVIGIIIIAIIFIFLYCFITRDRTFDDVFKRKLNSNNSDFSFDKLYSDYDHEFNNNNQNESKISKYPNYPYNSKFRYNDNSQIYFQKQNNNLDNENIIIESDCLRSNIIINNISGYHLENVC